MQKLEKSYVIIVGIFCTLVVATNEIGTKIFSLPFLHIAVPCGLLTYPAVFACTDVVSEIFGKKRAALMVALGFFVTLINLLIIQLCIHVPGHNNWVAPDNPFNYTTVGEYQTAFLSVFGVNHTLVFGSMLAYICGQFVDIHCFHALKVKCKGKHLWIRNNLSTFLAQAIDTIIVNIVFLYIGLGLSYEVVLIMTIHYYLLKLIIAVLDTPFVYLGVHFLKKYLKAN